MRRSAPPERGPAAFVQLVVDDLGGDTIRLAGAEARHLGRSLRARPGEEYRATDGRGTRARVVVGACARESIELIVLERVLEPPPALRPWVATRCDGPRLDWLCEKAAELGAWALVPLAGGERPVRTDRLRRLAHAALGQSLGAWVLQVEEERPLEALLQGPESGRAPGRGAWSRILWAVPGGRPLGAIPDLEAGDVLLLAGPPEGFRTSEITLLREHGGVWDVDLGPRRLRSETAALALLAWFGLRQAAAEAPAGAPGRDPA